MISPSGSDASPPVRRWSQQRWFTWALSFAVWTLVQFLFTIQLHFYRVTQGREELGAWWWISGFLSAWFSALLTPPILSLARRFPVDRQRWSRSLGIHLLLATAFNALNVLYGTALNSLLDKPQVGSLATRFFYDYIINALTYAMLAAVGHALAYYQLLSERRARESELEAQLLQARLQALEMQLRPHFLFNALHTVAGLVRTQQNPEAVRMLAGLGDLLRSLLQGEGPSQVVPLRQELTFIEKYLHIEQIRFQDRLRTRIDVEPGALDALVPRLILQPLVENAIRHGIEAHAGSGEVEIRIHQEQERLWMQVRDTGLGPGQASARTGEARGIGLGNTRARLNHLYGEEHHFELTHAEGGGALARMCIPLRRQAAEARP